MSLSLIHFSDKKRLRSAKACRLLAVPQLEQNAVENAMRKPIRLKTWVPSPQIKMAGFPRLFLYVYGRVSLANLGIYCDYVRFYMAS